MLRKLHPAHPELGSVRTAKEKREEILEEYDRCVMSHRVEIFIPVGVGYLEWAFSSRLRAVSTHCASNGINLDCREIQRQCCRADLSDNAGRDQSEKPVRSRS